MEPFDWSRFELLSAFVNHDADNLILTTKPQTRCLRTFLEFLDTQDIPGPPSEPIKTAFEFTSQFTFLITKLYSNLERLPNSIKFLVEYEDGVLIATANAHLQSLLVSLVMALEFDSHVGRLAAEFADIDLGHQTAIFNDIEAFHVRLFKASNSNQHFKSTQTKLAAMDDCVVMISEADRNRCDGRVTELLKNSSNRKPGPSSSRVSNLLKTWHHCPVCDYKSDQKGNVGRHLKNIHSSDRSTPNPKSYRDSKTRFKCPKCDWSTKYKRNVWRHVREVHKVRPLQLTIEPPNVLKPSNTTLDCEGSSEEDVRKTLSVSKVKRYKCAIADCSKSYAQAYNLIYHSNIHNNIRPFECRENKCREAFFNPMNRFKHEKRHHKNSTISKPHCKKNSTRSMAIKHLCVVCDRKFPSPAIRDNHQAKCLAKFNN